MDLKEYLEEVGISIVKFAKKSNISESTMHNILKGRDMYLSVAAKIEEATKGAVTCTELAKGLKKQDLEND